MEDFIDGNDEFYVTKFESMLKTNSVLFFDSSAFEGIVHHYMDNGKISLAKKAIKLGMSQHPTSISLKFIYVELLVFEDKLIKAEKILKNLVEIEPTNEEIYIQKANILSKQDKHQEAIKSLEIALNYCDETEDIYALLGMEYLYLDEFESARLNFAKCLEVDFEDYSSLYNVVYCFEMLHQHDRAIEYLKDYINKDPYSEVAWHQLGRQHFALGAFEEALIAFDYAVVIDEYFLGGYLEKAKTLEVLKRYQEAIDNYLICLELADANSFTYLHIGSCYEALQNYSMATKFYEQTVHEDPLLDKGWLALTNVNYISGNYQKALRSIGKAIRIDDKNSLYWRKYSEITLKLNLFEESAKGFKKCLQLKDDSLEIWLGYADVLTFLGEYHDVLILLKEASKIHLKSFEIEYRIACLQMIFHNEKDGIILLEKALKKKYSYHKEIKILFPQIFKLASVKKTILKFKKIN